MCLHLEKFRMSHKYECIDLMMQKAKMNICGGNIRIFAKGQISRIFPLREDRIIKATDFLQPYTLRNVQHAKRQLLIILGIFTLVNISAFTVY